MPTSLSELASLCAAAIEGGPVDAGERLIRGPAALSEAQADEIGFLANPRYRPQLERTRAAAVLVALDTPALRSDQVLLRCRDVNRAWTKVVQHFAPAEIQAPPGADSRAAIDASARVDASASIGAFVSVGARAHIGARVRLEPGVRVDEDCVVGDDTRVCANAVLYRGVRVGSRCIVHAGAVLGADGFGFDPTPQGWSKVPQCGTVEIGDEVEIGANCTVDRARFGATRIGRGAKLDNLVHVAHNVVVGEHALLIAQVGIAGSAVVGPWVVLAGQVGVAGHVQIASGVRVSAQSGVTADVREPGDYMGTPARERMEHLRQQAQLARMAALAERVKSLERRLAESERPPG